MSQNYQIFALSEAMSYISHASGTEGNESILARRWYHTPDGPRAIPMLSGNALRQRLVRGPGARWLIDRWDLRGRLTLRQLHFLLHGGGNVEASTARNDMRRIADLHRLFPIARLLGGNLPDAILPGSLIVWDGMLVCREHAGRLAAISPCGSIIPSNLRPSEDFVSGWQETRSAVRQSNPDLISGTSADASDDGQLGICAGQAVVAGAMFAHGFVCQNVSEVEVGALLLSLRVWQAKGGTVGGKSSHGFGRLATSLMGDLPANEDAIIDRYVAHVDEVKSEAIQWLTDAFGPSVDGKPKREKKTAPGPATITSSPGAA